MTTLQDLDKFRKLNEQVSQLHLEISGLSRKRPNDEISEFKLKFINQLLTDANSLLTTKFMPFADFATFSQEELPSNSDVTMILSQYISCLERYRVANIKYNDIDFSWYWVINGRSSNIGTSAPKEIEDRE